MNDKAEHSCTSIGTQGAALVLPNFWSLESLTVSLGVWIIGGRTFTGLVFTGPPPEEVGVLNNRVVYQWSKEYHSSKTSGAIQQQLMYFQSIHLFNQTFIKASSSALSLQFVPRQRGQNSLNLRQLTNRQLVA